MADKKTDTVPTVPPFVHPDEQLVMLIACGTCKTPECVVGVVVPGFLYRCETGGHTVDKGCVIACAHCGKSLCADCVYKAQMQARIAHLTGH